MIANYKSAVAENIKKIIAEKCFSKSKKKKKAGYDLKIFSNMINGRKVIKDTDVARIANALDVEPNDLYGIKTDKVS